MNRRQWLGHAALAACPLGFCGLSGCGVDDPIHKPSGLTTQPAKHTPIALKDGDPTEVLLFDVFGTVVEWKRSLIAQFQQLGRGHGISADWQGLAIRWQAAYLPSLDDVRKNRRPFVGLETLRRESLDRLLPSFGLDALSETDRVEMVRYWSRLDAWPDTVAALTRLRSTFTIVALSNGGFAMLVELARRCRLPWDAVMSADLFRHFKPDAEVYRGAADLLARPPGSLMLVAAHNIDLAAARAGGLKTAYVQRPTEDARPTSNWSIIARDLNDLADQLALPVSK